MFKLKEGISAIPLFGICPKELKTGSAKKKKKAIKIYTLTFMTSLFIIVKMWKQPKCS